MVVDSGFQIASEVSVERGRGSMFFREPQRLGKKPHMRRGGTKYGHRQLAALDHDFYSLTHPRQHAGEVTGGFRFRDVLTVLAP